MSFVLIAEPEEVNAARIHAIMESTDRDFDYELVNSAEGVLDVLDRCKPDVFIGDMQMPVMSAAELFSTVEMLSPDTVRVVMTDGGKISDTVRFMNECRTFKIIIKPCRVADDLLTPIQAAIRHKQVMERILQATEEAGRGQDSTDHEYRKLKEEWMKLVSQHKRAVHVFADMIASNLALDASMPEKVHDRLKRWYQWMAEEYVHQILEGDGDYEQALQMMTSFCHDPAHGCTFQMRKKTPVDIETDRMKEITYILRLVTGICKDLMSNWNISVVIESMEKVHILRVRYQMEGTSYRVRNEELRDALSRATKLGIEAFGYKSAVVPKEKEIIFNVAMPRKAAYINRL